MADIIYSDLSYKINGTLFKVHNQLGKFCSEKPLPPSFEGEKKGRIKNWEFS